MLPSSLKGVAVNQTTGIVINSKIMLRTQVLGGTTSDKGILAPMNPSINGPLMRELKEKFGLVFLASFFRYMY
jgi:hypothetical protein